MELRHLRSFVTLAEELHFGRAAARIFLAQPALSHHIRQLEKELGARLFDRGPAGVSLTLAGETLLPDARAALWHADQARVAVRQAASGLTGRLRVGIFANGAAELTAPILAAFRSARPQVDVTVVELDLTQQTSKLGEHMVDVAIVRPPLDDPTVELTPLTMEPRVAVLARDHPLARTPRLMVEDLLGLPVPCAHPDQPRVWTDHCRLADRRNGRPVTEVGPRTIRTVGEHLYAVVLHRAMTTMGASFGRSHAVPGAAFVPIADLGASEVALATRREVEEPLPALFVSLARQVARQYPEPASGPVAG
jgi:DNA-binding transcriptional LysR family regulator